MREPSPTFIGIDPASPGGDFTVEAEGYMTPDGKLAIHTIWRHRLTIDGHAVEVSGEIGHSDMVEARKAPPPTRR